MSKEVVWTKIILETFLEESGILDRIELGDEKARILEGIMRSRCCRPLPYLLGYTPSKKKLTNFFHYVNMFMGKPNKVKPLFLKNLLHNHKRVGINPTLLVS